MSFCPKEEIMAKIKYQCKNCGWETSIREEWADLKPRRCMNKKCNTSFIRKPDCLIISAPDNSGEVKETPKPKRMKRQEATKIE